MAWVFDNMTEKVLEIKINNPLKYEALFYPLDKTYEYEIVIKNKDGIWYIFITSIDPSKTRMYHMKIRTNDFEYFFCKETIKFRIQRGDIRSLIKDISNKVTLNMRIEPQDFTATKYPYFLKTIMTNGDTIKSERIILMEPKMELNESIKFSREIELSMDNLKELYRISYEYKEFEFDISEKDNILRWGRDDDEQTSYTKFVDCEKKDNIKFIDHYSLKLFGKFNINFIKSFVSASIFIQKGALCIQMMDNMQNKIYIYATGFWYEKYDNKGN